MAVNSIQTNIPTSSSVTGEFVYLGGERFYAIRNVDKMPAFFISVISNVDHWLFVASNGGLTAGRVSPESALFPYVTVDMIYDSTAHTGSVTLIRAQLAGKSYDWEPFNRAHDYRYSTSRHLYKSTLGNKICFEEINHDLGLAFRYTWATSEEFGFARECEIENLSSDDAKVDFIDGLRNILPAGTPLVAQSRSSNLVDAYKWTELDEQTGLAYFTLYSGISDRAEPSESLRANTVYCLGLSNPTVLISSEQLDAFRAGQPLQQETHKRGIRGAYLVNQSIDLSAGTSQQWKIIADLERSQSDVVALRQQLKSPDTVAAAIASSIESGSQELASIMACADGFQATAEETVSCHHYANVLFNVLRGGIFDDQYNVPARDFVRTIKHFNKTVYERNAKVLSALPEKLAFGELLNICQQQSDPQLARLCYEYLPATFARRHGDPSRPWNKFAIHLKDDNGDRLLSYQGNWRDIFQNWEALAFSYPEFAENIIAKFVNASTLDGYNPYRITKQGIDWEVEEPDDPWSHIGYWGDHQIIYLLKLLEISQSFHPSRLGKLLHSSIFSYANVPYKIKSFDAQLVDPKNTVEYDRALDETIEERVAALGADGKLVLNSDGDVYLVNLLEKLLAPLLTKLGNLVIDGGIWLNTQRPEWNDANNALVGHGLSVVTLCYLRRYITFLQEALAVESGSVEISTDVAQWLSCTAQSLAQIRPQLGGKPINPAQRFSALELLGRAGSDFRQVIYARPHMHEKDDVELETITNMLADALFAIDHTIANNHRSDGLMHTYNLIDIDDKKVSIKYLYPMLEGQVAALSSGALTTQQSGDLVKTLFHSDVYRDDQQTFMLYPDRPLASFLEKNQVDAKSVEKIGLLQKMLASGDSSIIARDAEGTYRFSAQFTNAGDLNAKLDSLANTYGEEVEAARAALNDLHEDVFNHQAFTGRSGGMFGFEGLGCIYWHMVSKLLLAVQENFFTALEQSADAQTCQTLGDLYYRVRNGIGFNKSPAEFGAFPTDPYSHTPKHAGAQQPGMTGQVKEEVLTRFGELGIRVSAGSVRFNPRLLRAREFVTAARNFSYMDIDGNWQSIAIEAGELAFTWCQVPIVYRLDESADESLRITFADGKTEASKELALSDENSREIFKRSGRVRKLELVFANDALFPAQ